MGHKSRNSSTFANWQCGTEGCGYHNFAFAIECQLCSTSRAGADIIADSGHQSFPTLNSTSVYGMGPGSMADNADDTLFEDMDPGSLADNADDTFFDDFGPMNPPSNYGVAFGSMTGITTIADPTYASPRGPPSNYGWGPGSMTDTAVSTDYSYLSPTDPPQESNESFSQPPQQAPGLGLRAGSRNLVDPHMQLEQQPRVQEGYEQEEPTRGPIDDLDSNNEVSQFYIGY
jgi:hypothetical protein